MQRKTYLERILGTGILLLTICTIPSVTASGQGDFLADRIYKPSIKTARFHRAGWDMTYPVIELNGMDQVELSFDDLTDQIRENAQAPKRAKGDAAEMEQHSLTDQIAADRYLASKKAAKTKHFGIATAKIVPPGAG